MLSANCRFIHFQYAQKYFIKNFGSAHLSFLMNFHWLIQTWRWKTIWVSWRGIPLWCHISSDQSNYLPDVYILQGKEGKHGEDEIKNILELLSDLQLKWRIHKLILKVRRVYGLSRWTTASFQKVKLLFSGRDHDWQLQKLTECFFVFVFFFNLILGHWTLS
jgi:hypothetical protein